MSKGGSLLIPREVKDWKTHAWFQGGVWYVTINAKGGIVRQLVLPEWLVASCVLPLMSTKLALVSGGVPWLLLFLVENHHLKRSNQILLEME